MKQGFWPMARHFVFDIFHYEGNFLSTLRLLFARPGKVAREYSEGRRATYLDPVRMYLFLSAITFILLPLFVNLQSSVGKLHIMATPVERLRAAAVQYQTLKQNPHDPSATQSLNLLLDTTVLLRLKPVGDTAPGAVPMVLDGKTYQAVAVSDSLAFPGRNWLERRASKKMRAKYEKEGEDLNALMASQNKSLLKMMPYLLFLSLPLFSFILQGLYRRNTKLFYSVHAVFTLYHYIVAFTLMLAAFFGAYVARLLHVNAFLFVYLPAIALLLTYLLLELKQFYKESWGKTLGKFVVLSVGSLLAIGVLFVVIVLLITVV